jgi:hypothetical protein
MPGGQAGEGNAALLHELVEHLRERRAELGDDRVERSIPVERAVIAIHADHLPPGGEHDTVCHPSH